MRYYQIQRDKYTETEVVDKKQGEKARKTRRDKLYGLLQAFFIERDPHSRTETGERDTVLSA